MSEFSPSAPVMLRTLRIVFLAMMMGVVVFAGAAASMKGGTAAGHAGWSAGTVRLVTVVWSCLALGLVFAAYRLTRPVAESLEGLGRVGPRLAEAQSGFSLSRLQGRLIVAAALAEMAAMTGVLAFIVTGSYGLLAGALAIAAVGFGVTFPRSAWFEPFNDPHGSS